MRPFLGKLHNPAQEKKTREKGKETKANNAGSTKPTMTPNRCAYPPKNSHRIPKPPNGRVPSNTFKKGSDDGDAVSRLILRFLPVHGGKWEEVYLTPFKKDGGA